MNTFAEIGRYVEKPGCTDLSVGLGNWSRNPMRTCGQVVSETWFPGHFGCRGQVNGIPEG
jgi:hypothetical protein